MKILNGLDIGSRINYDLLTKDNIHEVLKNELKYDINTEDDKGIIKHIFKAIGISIIESQKEDALLIIEYKNEKIFLTIDEKVSDAKYRLLCAIALSDILCNYTNGNNKNLYSKFISQDTVNNNDIEEDTTKLRDKIYDALRDIISSHIKKSTTKIVKIA